MPSELHDAFNVRVIPIDGRDAQGRYIKMRWIVGPARREVASLLIDRHPLVAMEELSSRIPQSSLQMSPGARFGVKIADDDEGTRGLLYPRYAQVP